uniref:TonB-dependent receptor n=1 Tax=Acidobacterium capsulatum TaxID=33075 RepID=A0A7V5CTX8_9BACT
MKYHDKKNSGRRKGWMTFLLLILFAALTAAGAYAQSDNGSITGTVTDQTGAVIPGAAITVSNTDTGLTFHSASNASGEFHIFAVPRGNYKADVTAPGFQSQSTSFQVQVTTTQTLLFKLQPGAVSTTVQVTAAAPLVNTSNGTIGDTIRGKQVTHLPLNGRNFTGLALLTPGVTRGAYGNGQSGVSGNTESFRDNESGGAALSVNGLDPTADNYLLDGLDDNDSLFNTIVNFPNIDATDEFKVDTSVAPAQYGRAGGAIVASSIKGGTNQYHGSAFWFYRSGKFDANPSYRFLGAPASPNPAFNRNQPGFSIGGPFIKNKLFGFGDYQAFREVQPINPYYLTVPTARMRQGDFGELLNNPDVVKQFSEPYCLIHQGVSPSAFQAMNNGQIYDPQTCQPIPNNNVAAAGIAENQAAVNYFNAYPAPQRPGVINNFLAHEQQFTHYNTFDVRLDYDATPKDVAFLRFSYDNSAFTKTPELGTLPSGFGTGSSYVHARSWALGYTHTFTPSIVNELLLGYNRDNYGYQPPFYGDALSAKLGIVNANRNQETSGGALIGGNAGIDYTGDYGLYAVPQNTIEASDTVDWEHGHHSFKFGATGILRNLEYFRPIAGKGYFNFGNGDFTGFPTSEMLIGFTDNYTIGAQSGYYSNISYEDGFFAQDDWRVSQRLTLNLGLRYDLMPWPYETHNRMASFDINPSSNTYGQVLLAGKNGVRRSIMANNYGDVAPRIGFAWDMNGNGTRVLRGGYGIYYFPNYGGIGNQLGQQVPFGGSVSYDAQHGYCVTFTGQTQAPGSAYGCQAAATQTAPLPAPGFPNFNPANPPTGLSTLAVNIHNKNQGIQEWNLQLEQQFGKYDVVDLAYVGNKADHLSEYYNYNLYHFVTGLQNFPQFGGITYNTYNGSSNYNGLQLHFEHRQGKDLVVTGSYSWSHTMDDQPGTIALYYNPQASYGNSNQDQRNVFTSSILYQLPFGRGERFFGHASYPVNLIIGGWQLSVIGHIASGNPFDLSVSNFATADTPDVTGPITYPKSISGTWFNTAAFTPAPSTQANGQNVFTRVGTLARNQVYGPGQRSADVSLEKDIQFTNRYVLQLHGDAFNVTNTPQFTNPDGGFNDSTFGKVTGIELDSQREIQLAARFVF